MPVSPMMGNIGWIVPIGNEGSRAFKYLRNLLYTLYKGVSVFEPLFVLTECFFYLFGRAPSPSGRPISGFAIAPCYVTLRTKPSMRLTQGEKLIPNIIQKYLQIYKIGFKNPLQHFL